MAPSPCCSKEGLNRGPWSAEEDTILTEYIRIHGDCGWRKLPQKAGLNRCGKSCRLRWLNYLRPDIKRGNISSDEEDLIIRMHRLLGNRWSLIAGRLPGRTDNEIKNYWNTRLSKKLSICNRSQPNTRQNLKTRSKSPSVLQKTVFKTTVPIRITNRVKHSEMVSPNGWNGSGCSNGISPDHAFKLSITINESTSPSKSRCNVLLVNDSITEDVLAVSNPGVDVNLVETEEVRNFNCSVSTLAVQQSPHCDDFARHASPLGESLCDLKELLSPQCNLLSSPFISWTDFGLEEFCTGLATSLTEETDEPEGMCSNNSFTFADDQGREEIYDNSQHVDWIRELDYI